MLPLIPLAVSALLEFVPALSRWFGGDKAGEVAGQVAEVVAGIAGGTDPAAIAAAISDPAKAGELRAKLAQIAADREREERAAENAELVARLSDVADARKTTATLAASGSRMAWAAPFMSVLIVLGFIAVVLLMMFSSRAWDERTAGLLGILFGGLLSAFNQVCNYFLGSSAGSADKARTIAATAAAAQAVALPLAAAAAAASAPSQEAGQ